MEQRRREREWNELAETGDEERRREGEMEGGRGREGGMEGGREGGREGEMDGGRGREVGREGEKDREGGRERVREGGRKRGRKRWREGVKERGRKEGKKFSGLKQYEMVSSPLHIPRRPSSRTYRGQSRVSVPSKWPGRHSRRP